MAKITTNLAAQEKELDEYHIRWEYLEDLRG
jgi:hypothetical protein